MPRGDKTGPMGQGPMTGRALGYCAGYDSPGFTKCFGEGKDRVRGKGLRGGMDSVRGQGFGSGMAHRNRFGFGAGMGRGCWNDYSVNPPVRNKTEEIDALIAEAEDLKSRQGQIEQRIKELENKTI